MRELLGISPPEFRPDGVHMTLRFADGEERVVTTEKVLDDLRARLQQRAFLAAQPRGALMPPFMEP